MASKSDDTVQLSLAASSLEAAWSFERLSSLLHYAACEARAASKRHEVEDQLTRFRIWAGNIGAFHDSSSTASLDYRLRVSPEIETQVHEHLEDLKDCLTILFDISSGQRPNRFIESDDEDEYEDYESGHKYSATKFEEPAHHHGTQVRSTEAEESFGTIKDSITGLFRLSMLMRKHSPRDRFAKALSGPNPFDETFDIAHVAHKFPKLNQVSNAWLKLRLGRAITQRRRYLQYVREHRLNLGRGIEGSTNVNMTTQRSALLTDQLSTQQQIQAGLMKASGRSNTLAPTSASTLLLPSAAMPREDFESSRSQTSFAMSLGGEDQDDEIRLPKLADVSNGNDSFECPLCWTIQSFRSEATWRKHILTDLRPYVCTFVNCDLKLFPNRRDWFHHEMSCHRRAWFCPFCQQREFQRPDVLRQHLGRYHLHDRSKDQLDTLVDSSIRPVKAIGAFECPFCDDWQADLERLNPGLLGFPISVTPTQFRRHVGSHMQKLALFAIPRSVLEQDGLDTGSVASAGAAGSASTTSSSAYRKKTCIGFSSAVVMVVCLQRWKSRTLSPENCISEVRVDSTEAAGLYYQMFLAKPNTVPTLQIQNFVRPTQIPRR